jgi:predicted DNA-binding ribbon-helix-helix protein
MRMQRHLKQSLNHKRSVVIGRCKTSVCLEDAFWKALKEIALIREMPRSDLLAKIDSERQNGNLSSAIRVFVLNHYRVPQPPPIDPTA